MSLACFSLRVRAHSHSPRRRAVALVAAATVATLVPLTAPLRAAALSFSASELWGDHNPGETGTGFLAAGLPVDPDTGNLVLRATDLSVGGRGRGMLVARTYNSLDAAGSTAPDALGWGWSFTEARHLSVDATTGSVTVSQENGSTISFAPAGGGAFTAAPQVVATLAQSQTDGSYTETLPDGSTETFSPAGALIAEGDRNGYATTLSYSGSQLTTVTDPAGRTLAFGYDANGRLASITDPASRVVRYGYDTAGNLATVTDVGGGVTHYGYDGAHHLTSVLDAAGGQTVYTYDGFGRVITVTDGAGHGHLVQYGSGGATVVDGLGRATQYLYGNHLLSSVTRGYGTGQATTMSYAYDAAGNRTQATDGRGGNWSATFDSRGNRTSWTDPTSRTWTAQYNGFGEPSQVTDPAGVATSYFYDATGNLTDVSRQLVVTGHPTVAENVFYGYDPAHPGDLVSYQDPLTNTWSFGHDATTGDLLTVTDPYGAVTSATYNGIDWQMSTTTPRGNASTSPAQFTTTVTRNAWGDVLTLTEPTGGVWTTIYDAMRRVHTRTDPLANSSTYSYDGAGEQTSVSRAGGAVWTTSYDAAGEISVQADGLTHATTYGYDWVGRLASVSDPLHRMTTYQYNAADDLTQASASGQVTQYTYDGAHRLATVVDGTGSNTVQVASYTYDLDGRRASLADATGTSTWSYDSLGRLVGSSNGAGQVVQYGYDDASRLTTITYPGNLAVSGGAQASTASPGFVQRRYDNDGRLIAVTDFSGQHVTSYGYDADGNLVSAGLPNLVTETLGYDNSDRVVNQTAVSPQGVTLLSLPYTRNAAGLIASANPTGVSGGAGETYAYDGALRFAGATPSSGTPNTRGDGYDAADELTGLTTGAATSQLTYDAAGELASQVAQPLGVVTSTYGYDGLGDRTRMTDGAGNVSTYTWDQNGRMTGFTGPVLNTLNGQTGTTVQQVAYGYDGSGLLQSRRVTVPSTTTQVSVENLAYDVAQGAPQMIEDGTMSYITGAAGAPLEQVNAAGTPLYYLTDPSGSTRLVTDSAGRVVQSYTYSDHGVATPSSSSLVQPYQFQGLLADTSNGLLLSGGRYYDPATGQFLSRAAASTAPQRPYVAAGDDPLNAPPASPLGPAAHTIAVCPPVLPTATTDWADMLRAAVAARDAVAAAATSPGADLLP